MFVLIFYKEVNQRIFTSKSKFQKVTISTTVKMSKSQMRSTAKLRDQCELLMALLNPLYRKVLGAFIDKVPLDWKQYFFVLCNPWINEADRYIGPDDHHPEARGEGARLGLATMVAANFTI